METRKLIIVRGISGSGKSTIARHLASESQSFWETGRHGLPWFEADEFFIRSSGSKYKFDSSKLSQAHHLCQLKVEHLMFHDVPCVVVSNTSTRIKEMQPYLDLADQYGYEVQIIRSPGPWDPELLHQRNTHSVPLDTLRKQIARYAPHPDEVEWTDMSIF